MKSIFKRVLLVSVLAGAGCVALAQSSPGMGPSMAGAPHEGMQRGMHRPDPARMQAMVTKRLAALKVKLKITADQETAWSTFSAAMKPPAAMGQRADRAEMSQLTTPERIDKMRAIRAIRQAEMDKHGDAVKALYAVLTPEQKKVFDSQHMRHERKGGMGE